MNRTTLERAGAILGLLFLSLAAITFGAQTPELDKLAEKGEALSKEDPLSSELRKRQPDDRTRRGFDIGMGAAEGHTAPGPGKDATRAKLGSAEQKGFDQGVLFSLERNRSADLARVGAAIAAKNRRLDDARTADIDVFFWLGFDIATGIFGDPKQGAKGNTLTGPGSLKIRDALCAAGQRGFNASLTFHHIPLPAAAPSPPGKIDPNAVFSEVAKTGNSRTIGEILKLPFIHDVQVRPDSRNVVISFFSTQSTPPLIEIGKVPPKLIGGIQGFPTDSGAFARFAPEKKGRFVLDLDVQNEQLAIGTNYYYIINVFNDNKKDAKRPRDQVTGKFTTLPQNIKVVFTEIFIDTGLLSYHHPDYVFQFDVKAPGARELGPQEPWYSSKVTGRRTYGTPSAPLKLQRGANGLQGFEVVLEWVPDALGIEVFGQVPNLQYISQKILREDTLYKNTARGGFDLSAYPGDTVTIPFILTSNPPSKLDNGKVTHGLLQFRIKGRIEVTRIRPS